MNQINSQECPQNTDELDMLIYALINENFDKTPEKLARELEELKERLSAKGISEEMIQAYWRILGNSERDEEAEAYMLRWGKNRGEAIRNYMAHFKRPCNWCIDVYTDLLANHTLYLMEREKIDIPNEPKRIEEFLLKAHLDYLGNLKIGVDNIIRLEDVFASPN